MFILIVFEGFLVITYDKGAAVLRMLAATLGADNFQKGMQRYLDRYKFGNADHVQYFEVMTEVNFRSFRAVPSTVCHAAYPLGGGHW